MTVELPPLESYEYLVAPRFLRDLESLVHQERELVTKAIRLLSQNPRHPGLQYKKLHAAPRGEVWEARVDQARRLLYQWVDGWIYLWRVGPHSVIDEAAKLGRPDLDRAVAPDRPMPGATAAISPTPAPVTVPPPGLFACFSSTLLQLLGVPEERVDAVRAVHDAEQVWDLDMPKEVQVSTVDAWLWRFCQERRHPVAVDRDRAQEVLHTALSRVPALNRHRVLRRPIPFFAHEIERVIKGRGLATREGYLAIERVGAGTGLGEAARHAVWDVSEAYQRELARVGPMDFGDVRLLYVGMTPAAERLYLITTRGVHSPFLDEIDPATLVWCDAD
ncbi:MAG: hypothetical protein C4290_13630 [Chloroflexota bacterium]